MQANRPIPAPVASRRRGSGTRHCRVTSMALAVLALMGPLSADAARPTQSAEGPWAKGRLIVMPKPGLDEKALDRIVGAHGGKASKITAGGLYVVELPSQASEKAVAAQLAHNPHLKFAELDRQIPTATTVNDPYYGSAWHLDRVRTPAAWGKTMGNGVTIAVIDTGVDANHPDLSTQLVPGWNFYDNNSNTSDVAGHGTGVAGAAAAATNNSVGVAAVSGQAKIMPIRATDTSGVGYISMIAQGITWAADKGAKVINLSFDRLWTFSSVVSAAEYAKSKGSLVVIAASNNAKDEGAATQSAMIPVSATDKYDKLTTFSSWGNHVAIAAPGIEIWSTTRGGGYGAWWGTSVASPVTAGVVALMMAANPKLSNTEVEKLLYASARDLGTAGRDKYYGYGLVDAEAAVGAALNASGTTTDAQAPTVAIAAPLSSSTVSGLTPVNISASDNVGIAKVELRVNGSLLATDTTSPFGFSWDTTRVSNGMASLEARAYDAAGNVASSPVVSVNVANPADSAAPSVKLTNPADGSRVSGTVKVSGGASDDSGSAGITMSLFINGQRVATSTGTGALSYSWNTRRIKSGSYTLQLDAQDAAGNKSSSSVKVTR